MLLSVVIYCLASPIFWKDYCDYAKELLLLFVRQVGQLYGENQYVYNIHGLVHLADDVAQFGYLDNFSACVFESFLGRLKKLVRKSNFPLQQVIRRLSENCLTDINSSNTPMFGYGIVKKQHHNGPLPMAYNAYLQYEQICLANSFFLSIRQGNNCVLVEGQVRFIRNILSPCENSDVRVLLVENFKDIDNFFTEPLNSSDLCIFQV